MSPRDMQTHSHMRAHPHTHLRANKIQRLLSDLRVHKLLHKGRVVQAIRRAGGPAIESTADGACVVKGLKPQDRVSDGGKDSEADLALGYKSRGTALDAETRAQEVPHERADLGQDAQLRAVCDGLDLEW